MMKRLFDFTAALLGLIILSPVFLVIGIWIILDSPGGVFFRGVRVGQHGKDFRIFKFRSMKPDCEGKGKWNVGDKDDRITRLGHFLRKSKLDELPQLINVVRGEMSLVGPRPIEQKEVDDYYSAMEARLMFSTRPGITGMWQVSGRSGLEVLDRKKLNLYYVANWSVWLDIAILIKTPLAVLSEKGAY